MRTTRLILRPPFALCLTFLVLWQGGVAQATPAASCKEALGAKKGDCSSFVARGGHVGFLAIGRPKMLEIHGKGSAPEGRAQVVGGRAVTGEFSFDLKSLETGLTLRDRHLREKYLEVDKPGFDRATLVIDGLTLPTHIKDIAELSVPFSGALNLRNVSQTVNGKMRIRKISDKKYQVETDFPVSLPAFNIPKPSFAGVGVEETVQVRVAIDSLESELL
jgi:hypothetical protein